ncbi:hypothetical protein GR157_23905 [Burkholderia sp. 4701]|nr:hypothetical protein [Burkholderia sp. 4701]MXN84961.1 hypothetical protein [Burkholderia sp. 4812]
MINGRAIMDVEADAAPLTNAQVKARHDTLAAPLGTVEINPCIIVAMDAATTQALAHSSFMNDAARNPG